MVREDRVREILAEAKTLKAALDQLVEEANRAGGRDNITVVAFRVGGDEAASPAPDETVVDLRKASADAGADGEGRSLESATPVERMPPVAPAPRRPGPRSREPRRPKRRGLRSLVVLL